MTQEEKQILFKNLCAMLPYGVIVEYGCKHEGKDLGERKSKLTGRMIDSFFGNITIGMSEVYSLQPYLRPMESMTNDEKEEVNKLFEHESSFLTPYPSWYVFEDNIQKVVDFYLSHHLDWRGLIEMGLALEAPEGMYKTD